VDKAGCICTGKAANKWTLTELVSHIFRAASVPSWRNTRKQAARNKSCHNRQRKKLWNMEFINKNSCTTSQSTAKKLTEYFIVNFLSSKTGFFLSKISFRGEVTFWLSGPANRHRPNAGTLDSNNTLQWLIYKHNTPGGIWKQEVIRSVFFAEDTVTDVV
jgi:hypothetical protein